MSGSLSGTLGVEVDGDIAIPAIGAAPPVAGVVMPAKPSAVPEGVADLDGLADSVVALAFAGALVGTGLAATIGMAMPGIDESIGCAIEGVAIAASAKATNPKRIIRRLDRGGAR